MKDVGIVGLPGAGSSTIFTALTAIDGAASGSSNQAAIPVPDERVVRLGELHESKKLIYTQLRFLESSGMVRRGSRAGAGRLNAELIGVLRTVDALLTVVRGFGEDADPESELSELMLEMTIADLEPVASKLDRDRRSARDPEAKRQIETLERAVAVLEAGTPLRDEAWDDIDRSVFQGMGMLTMKPSIAVLNADEQHLSPVPAGMVAVAGALEAEVAGLDEADAAELLEGYGLTERALPAVVRAIYEQLDLITFLTAGDKETRAWEVRRGALAPEAAGVIHSDIQRGFIRADVIAYDDLVEAGSWVAARAAGTARQEGKAYEIREGDVVEFRFAV